MFEDYLQDSHHFLLAAQKFSKQHNDRQARRFYRASVFYASGAIESFINYIGDSFAKGNSIPKDEIRFLNDKTLKFDAAKGFVEKTEYHRPDDKIRCVLRRSTPSFDFRSPTWSTFMEFKRFRDALVHPRALDDDIELSQYSKEVTRGLASIIDIMNDISTGVWQSPLRQQLLDLIPD